MKKLFKHYLEFLILIVPLAVIVYGIFNSVYKSETELFEKVSFIDISYAQNPIKLLSVSSKEDNQMPKNIKFKPYSVIAENKQYIVKKQKEGIFIVFDKESNKTRIIKEAKDSDMLKLIGLNNLHPEAIIGMSNMQCDKYKTLAKNDDYTAIKDNCGYLKIIKNKDDTLFKNYYIGKTTILDAKFYKDYLFYYSNDGISTFDIDSMQEVNGLHDIGLKGDFATLFPIRQGVIALVVTKDNNVYLLYYRYVDTKKLKLANTYRMKKSLYEAKIYNNSLYFDTKERIYKIYPKGNELEYEIQ